MVFSGAWARAPPPPGSMQARKARSGRVARPISTAARSDVAPITSAPRHSAPTSRICVSLGSATRIRSPTAAGSRLAGRSVDGGGSDDTEAGGGVIVVDGGRGVASTPMASRYSIARRSPGASDSARRQQASASPKKSLP